MQTAPVTTPATRRPTADGFEPTVVTGGLIGFLGPGLAAARPLRHAIVWLFTMRALMIVTLAGVYFIK